DLSIGHPQVRNIGQYSAAHEHQKRTGQAEEVRRPSIEARQEHHRDQVHHATERPTPSVSRAAKSPWTMFHLHFADRAALPRGVDRDKSRQPAVDRNTLAPPAAIRLDPAVQIVELDTRDATSRSIEEPRCDDARK